MWKQCCDSHKQNSQKNDLRVTFMLCWNLHESVYHLCQMCRIKKEPSIECEKEMNRAGCQVVIELYQDWAITQNIYLYLYNIGIETPDLLVYDGAHLTKSVYAIYLNTLIDVLTALWLQTGRFIMQFHRPPEWGGHI